MKNVADIYALSPMQQLMLFHARTNRPTHDVLFNQIVYEINGALNVEAYRRAWQLMIDRHQALRTIFVWQDGKDPLQVVREKVALPWVEHDWRELTGSEQERELNDLLAADRALGFDLLHAPLMRISLIQINALDYRLVWSSHHLIIDRWCIGIIFEELKSAYEAYTAAVFPTLAPAPRYSDYISWLARQDVDQAQAYWQEALRDVRAQPLPLKSVTENETADLDVVRISLEGEDWTALRQFALESNVTPSTLVTAAWALVLGAATGAEAALFGLTVSGRPTDLPEVGRTVGCFINNVPLHVPLQGKQSLLTWLQAVQNQQLGLQSYEYASLAQIQAWSGLKMKGPLFDTLLVLQAPMQSAAPADLTVEIARGGMQTGYPISLGAVPGKDSLRLTLNYDRRYVPQKMIKQIASALQRVLLAMPAAQEALLHDVRAQAQIDAPMKLAVQSNGRSVHDKRSFVPPRNRTEQALAEIWAEVLDLPQVGIEDKFYDLGGDSIKALQLFTLIEQLMGKDVPISMLFGNPSVAQMAEAIGEDAADLPKDPVVVPIKREGSQPPVFFTHGVYGGLLWLKNLAPLLDPEQPAYGLQALGLQPDSEPDYSIEAMAARYVEAMRRIQPSGPYYLTGFCFGGVVAYEIARQLEQLGETTALLAIIDGFIPRVRQHKRSLYDPRRLQIIRQNTPYWFQKYKDFSNWRIRERLSSKTDLSPDQQQDAKTYAEENKNSDYLEALIAASRETQQQVTKINQRAGDEYLPQVYGGQVTFFHAQRLGIRPALFGQIDPERGWGNLAMGGVIVRPVDGTHVGVLTQPYVSGLAEELNVALRSAMAVNQ